MRPENEELTSYTFQLSHTNTQISMRNGDDNNDSDSLE